MNEEAYQKSLAWDRETIEKVPGFHSYAWGEVRCEAVPRWPGLDLMELVIIDPWYKDPWEERFFGSGWHRFDAGQDLAKRVESWAEERLRFVQYSSYAKETPDNRKAELVKHYRAVKAWAQDCDEAFAERSIGATHGDSAGDDWVF